VHGLSPQVEEHRAAALLELDVQIGIGEAALGPVLEQDDVAGLRTELGVEPSTPAAVRDPLGLFHPGLGRVHVMPPVIVAFAPAVVVIEMILWLGEYSSRLSHRSAALGPGSRWARDVEYQRAEGTTAPARARRRSILSSALGGE
jgi:hypothetical protein